MVTTRLEHNSVLRPLNHLQRDHGVSVTYVARDAQGYVDPEAIRKAITPQTRVIVVNHASNVLGSVQDLEAIGQISRSAETVFVVDSCQTAGVLPVDMDAMAIDVLSFTGHKGFRITSYNVCYTKLLRGARQPITLRPEVGSHPDGLNGFMVYFGTGKYMEIGDNSITPPQQVQTFYGIWDQKGASTGNHT